MQGGCICENGAYLRVGTTNIELSALIAPRPLGMTGANDWTIDIETKGLPELKTIYKMYGAEDKVMAKYLSFPHNYNQVSREVMYNFFNKHLKLGLPEPVRERPFEPVPPSELSVYDEQHPRPKDEVGADGVKKVSGRMVRETDGRVDPDRRGQARRVPPGDRLGPPRHDPRFAAGRGRRGSDAGGIQGRAGRPDGPQVPAVAEGPARSDSGLRRPRP